MQFFLLYHHTQPALAQIWDYPNRIAYLRAPARSMFTTIEGNWIVCRQRTQHPSFSSIRIRSQNFFPRYQQIGVSMWLTSQGWECSSVCTLLFEGVKNKCWRNPQSPQHSMNMTLFKPMYLKTSPRHRTGKISGCSKLIWPLDVWVNRNDDEQISYTCRCLLMLLEIYRVPT